jgi:hypothetical protein
MDPCEKVSKLLQCGKENMPDAVAGIMNNVENALDVCHCCIFLTKHTTFIFFAGATYKSSSQ